VTHYGLRFLAASLILACLPVLAQDSNSLTPEEDFRAFTESPRIFLRPQRLRLLQRERERQSIRWEQFSALVAGRAPMAEPGIALALYSRISGEKGQCKEAERAAGRDLRQMAIVYDWCAPPLLAGPLLAGADRLASRQDVPSVRTRALAAIALAETQPEWSEATMKDIIVRWWRGGLTERIRRGETVPRTDLYALFELLHVVRDNLKIDLRDPVQGFFRELPVWHLLSYYPAAYPGAENEFRIPYYREDGEPDLRIATWSRAAELAMVAFDSNPIEMQAMQAWLMQDRYLMRGPLGIVYEFLWANPYQPGITYHALPNLFHDRRGGRLFMRSNWDEDATFFCYDQGTGQVFEAGKRADVNVAAQKKPVRIGSATILPGPAPVEFETGFSVGDTVEPGEKRAEENWFVVGLKPGAPYHVEGDDEEMFEVVADSGGVIALQYPRPRAMKVRVHEPRVTTSN
jgi:hypothetical protein